MEQRKTNTAVAGVDVSKRMLDVAVDGLVEMLRVANTPAGFVQLGDWLASHGVGRVGLEATGGYEQDLVWWLQAKGYEVVVHPPAAVRQFARFKRLKAKNDKIDARLIALATAQTEAVKAACDPRLAELAERMTAYEQAADHLARMKTEAEHVRLKDLRKLMAAEMRRMLAYKRKLALDLIARIKAWPDLAARYQLLQSLPGFGPLVAAAIAIRMPELGSLDHGQAASLIGVAPFARDSGLHQGQRFISGGRERPRRMLYIAANVAKRFDPSFKAFAANLTQRGKPPKVATVAVMRKLIEAANLVLGRGQPWTRASAS
jgi:transposase